ncbi:MAG TPA: fluoride efflux transporter CrcB [Rubricoccaceae bacterium]
MRVPPILLVALGGALGAAARYAAALALGRPTLVSGLPLGTLVVNLAGCLLVGLVVPFVTRPGAEPARLLVVVGVLGGFTTLSAFSLESVELLRAGKAGAAVLYGALSVGLGLTLTALGLRIARALSATGGP